MNLLIYLLTLGMKIDRENLHLFVGGGIIDLSIPEDEWEETQIKSETLLSIIKK